MAEKYKEALKIIAKAKKEKSTELDLNGLELTALLYVLAYRRDRRQNVANLLTL